MLLTKTRCTVSRCATFSHATALLLLLLLVLFSTSFVSAFSHTLQQFCYDKTNIYSYFSANVSPKNVINIYDSTSNTLSNIVILRQVIPTSDGKITYAIGSTDGDHIKIDKYNSFTGLLSSSSGRSDSSVVTFLLKFNSSSMELLSFQPIATYETCTLAPSPDDSNTATVFCIPYVEQTIAKFTFTKTLQKQWETLMQTTQMSTLENVFALTNGDLIAKSRSYHESAFSTLSPFQQQQSSMAEVAGNYTVEYHGTTMEDTIKITLATGYLHKILVKFDGADGSPNDTFVIRYSSRSEAEMMEHYGSNIGVAIEPYALENIEVLLCEKSCFHTQKVVTAIIGIDQWMYAEIDSNLKLVRCKILDKPSLPGSLAIVSFLFNAGAVDTLFMVNSTHSHLQSILLNETASTAIVTAERTIPVFALTMTKSRDQSSFYVLFEARGNEIHIAKYSSSISELYRQQMLLYTSPRRQNQAPKIQLSYSQDIIMTFYMTASGKLLPYNSEGLVVPSYNTPNSLLVVARDDCNSCNNTKCLIPVCFGKSLLDDEVCMNRGICLAPDTCKCSPIDNVFTGKFCEQAVCFGKSADAADVCSKRGTCTGPNKCQCVEFARGESCELYTCFGYDSSSPDACSGRGDCIDLNVCKCHANYTGSECDKLVSPQEALPECAGHNLYTYNTATKPVAAVLHEVESALLANEVVPDPVNQMIYFFAHYAVQRLTLQGLAKSSVETVYEPTTGDIMLSALDTHKHQFIFSLAADRPSSLDSYTLLKINANTKEVNSTVIQCKRSCEFVSMRVDPISGDIFISGNIENAGGYSIRNSISAEGCYETSFGTESAQFIIQLKYATLKCVWTSRLGIQDTVNYKPVVIPSFQDSIIVLFRQPYSGRVISHSIVAKLGRLSRDTRSLYFTRIFKDDYIEFLENDEKGFTYMVANNAIKKSKDLSAYSIFKTDSQFNVIWNTTIDSVLRANYTSMTISSFIVDEAGTLLVIGTHIIGRTSMPFFLHIEPAYGTVIHSWSALKDLKESGAYANTTSIPSSFTLGGLPFYPHKLLVIAVTSTRSFKLTKDIQTSAKSTSTPPFLLSMEYEISHCKSCPPGHFKKWDEKSQRYHCTACPAGTMLDPSMAVCRICLPGSYSTEASTECSLCPIGFYTNDKAQGSCEPCVFRLTFTRGATLSQCYVAALVTIIGCIAIAGMLVLVIAILAASIRQCVLAKRKRKKKQGRGLLSEYSEGERVEIHLETSMFEIKFEDLKISSEIGTGGSGAVIYKATWMNQPVAVKMFRIAYDTSQISSFEHELKLLSSLRHNNIVAFYGATLNMPRIGLVTEFCQHGSLSAFIKKESSVAHSILNNFFFKLEILLGVARGMHFLHSKGIIHRDLKSDNILIDSNFNCKVTDFGVSKLVHNSEEAQKRFTQNIGTSIYIAPEVVLGKNYDKRCDTFSYSMIMFEVLLECSNPYQYKTTAPTMPTSLRTISSPLSSKSAGELFEDDESSINSVGFNIEFRVAQDETFRPRVPDASFLMDRLNKGTRRSQPNTHSNAIPTGVFSNLKLKLASKKPTSATTSRTTRPPLTHSKSSGLFKSKSEQSDALMSELRTSLSSTSSTGSTNSDDSTSVKLEQVERVLDLMRRCWSHKPESRPTFDNIITELEEVVLM